MKVLWFTNTPANGDKFLNNELKESGGWLKTFDIHMQNEVDLHIAFHSDLDIKNFKFKNSHYYPIVRKQNGLIQKVLNRFNTKIDYESHIKEYVNIINHVKPDIIHIHGTEKPFGLIQSTTEIPVVVSIQGIISIVTHKYFSGIEKEYFIRCKRRVWKMCRKNSLLHTYKYFKSWEKSERAILKDCKYIIGRTDWDRRVTRILSPKSKYFYVGEIMRESFYTKLSSPSNTYGKLIFTTSGNTAYKGFETLCHSLKLLLNQGFNDVVWQVAGVNENDAIVEVVKRKLGNDFPASNLVLLGRLSESELLKHLLRAHIYVMPSHIDNSPNSLCEAMLLGTSCIATNVGGTASLIENDSDGILIQDGDPWHLAGAVKELLGDPELRSRIGINARKKAMERHSPAAVCKQLIDTYISILNDKKTT